MVKLSEAVIRHRRMILIITLILCVASVFAAQTVRVNYSLSSYLPKDAKTTQALNLVSTTGPNLQLYIPGLSMQDAQAEKTKIAAFPGVTDVLWLDNLADIRDIPQEMLDPGVAGQYYHDGPLFQLTIEESQHSTTVPLFRAAYPDALMKGAAVDNAQQINVTMRQVASIMYLVVPLCLLILVLTTHHWLEPVLFLLAIGVAILLNEGTNIIFGSVSFVTRASSAVLQLAVSIDYAIFLLHRFSELREDGQGPVEAMKGAMVKSASAIISSAMTTVFGFLALTLMKMTLGLDMGLVLAKGVLLSYISVMIVLPATAIITVKWLEKSRHRSFMPSFKGFGRAVIRHGLPLAIIALLLLPPTFIAQQRNGFLYGSGGMHSPDSPIRQEQRKIEKIFGNDKMMLVLVPEGQPDKEAALGQELLKLPQIKTVMSYAATVSNEIPPGVLPEDVTSQFFEKGNARLILLADTEDEGPEAFRLVEDIRALAAKYYPEDNHVLGEPAVNHDLMTFITGDNMIVLLAGLVSIGLILLINFKNITVPFILLLIIEGSIWLNMGVPYFAGNTLNYIGYQIVSSVQLGATVDYGILLSQRYLEGRETMKPREAAAWALEVSTGSILSPALILTLAGYALGILVKDNGIISELGIIIGRGAAISCGMVLLVLPQVLVWCDGLIKRTYLHRRREKA